jgi:hypothetical protein
VGNTIRRIEVPTPHNRRRHRSAHLATLLIGSVAVTVPVAACGSSNPGSGTNAAAQADSKYTAGLTYAKCMRSHGVPSFPDPKVGSNGGMRIEATPGSMRVNGVPVNAPAFQAAMTACRSKLPNGGRPQPLSESRRRQMLAFSACMRSHGLPNFPDPTFSGGGALLRISPGSSMTPNSPAFKSAQTACGSFMPKLDKGPGGP